METGNGEKTPLPCYSSAQKPHTTVPGVVVLFTDQANIVCICNLTSALVVSKLWEKYFFFFAIWPPSIGHFPSWPHSARQITMAGILFPIYGCPREIKLADCCTLMRSWLNSVQYVTHSVIFKDILFPKDDPPQTMMIPRQSNKNKNTSSFRPILIYNPRLWVGGNNWQLCLKICNNKS